MALYLLYPADRTTPAEYAADRPVLCHNCCQEWDEDDDYGTHVDMVDGEFYCLQSEGNTRTCFSAAQDAAYRRDVAEAVTSALTDAESQILKLENLYPGALDDDDSIEHLQLLLAAAKRQIALFAAGEAIDWPAPTPDEHSVAAVAA